MLNSVELSTREGAQKLVDEIAQIWESRGVSGVKVWVSERIVRLSKEEVAVFYMVRSNIGTHAPCIAWRSTVARPNRAKQLWARKPQYDRVAA